MTTSIWPRALFPSWGGPRVTPGFFREYDLGADRDGIVVDFAAAYASLTASLAPGVVDGDLDNDGLCDLDEFDCFADLLAAGDASGVSSVASTFLLNRAQMRKDLGNDFLALIAGADDLFAAWLMLDDVAWVEGFLSGCGNCQRQYVANSYDLSLNAAIETESASCTIAPCAGNEGEGEGVVEGEGEGTVDGEGEGQVDGEGEGEGEGTVDGEGEGEGVAEGEGEGVAEGEGEGEGMLEGEGEGDGEPLDPFEQLLYTFASADVDANSRVTLAEILVQLPQFTQEDFDAADANGDGALSVAELLALSSAQVILSADTSGDYLLSLSELLRVVQLYNAGGYACAANPGATEDGYQPTSTPGLPGCVLHGLDRNGDNEISLSELLRGIQIFSFAGYDYCDGQSEDNFCDEP